MTAPSPAPSAERALHALQADLDLLRRWLEYGNKAVIADIESECVRVQMSEPGIWYDSRPMVDPREHAPQVVDEAAEALSLAESFGLIVRHPVQRYMLRIVGGVAR